MPSRASSNSCAWCKASPAVWVLAFTWWSRDSAASPTEGGMIGAAQKIEAGATRITFSGAGKARFRLQHARDCNGAPDDLSWCEVSQVSNGALDDPAHVIDAHRHLVRG